MGIYFEDKLLRAKEKGKGGDELETLYFEGLARINAKFKEHGGVIVLDRDFEEKKDTTGTNSMPAPPIALPVVNPMYIEPLGAINVRYSRSAPQRSNDGKMITYPGARLLVYDKMILTEREKDLAWYMLEATEFIEKEGVHNPAAFLKIHDPKKEVKEKISKLKRDALVDSYLLRDDSLLFNDESLTAIADRFGIELDGKNPKEINAYILRDAIVKGEESRNSDINIDLFIDFAKKMEAKLKAKANKAKGSKAKDKKDDTPVKTEGGNPDTDGGDGNSDATALVWGQYTEDYLSAMVPADRNAISKEHELDAPPKCKKEEQIRQILEKQAIDSVN
jgi:hypothetical protein